MRFGYDGDGRRLWKREYLPRPLGVVVRLTLYAGYGFEEGYVEEVQPHAAGAGEPPSDVCGKVEGVTDLGFTGQRQEIGFGLYDYKARYFSPALGRFISPDSIVPDFSNPQDLNRYSYVRNNPLKYIDPSGHDPWWLQDPWRQNSDELDFTGLPYPEYHQQVRVAQYLLDSVTAESNSPSILVQLLFEDPSHTIFGVEVNAVMPGSHQGIVIGMEGLRPGGLLDPLKPRGLTIDENGKVVLDIGRDFDLNDYGIYWFSGAENVTSVAGGGSISPYLGQVWNIENYEDYLGPTQELNLTVAVGPGVSVTAFWSNPPEAEGSINPNLPFGYVIGPAVGGEITFSSANTEYRAPWRIFTPPSYRYAE